MTDKEQQIRVQILPQLNSLANILWDDGNTPPQRARRLDNIIDGLTNILNQQDNQND
jgi:hypothetical protein